MKQLFHFLTAAGLTSILLGLMLLAAAGIAAAEPLPVRYREAEPPDSEPAAPARTIDNAAYIREFEAQRRTARRQPAVPQLIIIQEYRLPVCHGSSRRFQKAAAGLEYRDESRTWRWYRGYLLPERTDRSCLDGPGRRRR